MKFHLHAALVASLAATVLAAPQAQATNYTLWIHGKNGGGTQIGNYADFSYWGPASAAAGVNKKAVNWDGSPEASAARTPTSATRWTASAPAPTGATSPCTARVTCRSATRCRSTAAPRATRRTPPPTPAACAATRTAPRRRAGTSSGWTWPRARAAAASWPTTVTGPLSEPIVGDLVTTTARAMYNHNTTRSMWFYMFAGAKGTLYSGILPGQDDEAVAYHSTGGVSGSAGGAYCNPGDWFCNDLTTGSGACEGNHAKWSFHTVDFRDDGEEYTHSGNGNWEGIVSKVRADVATYAQ